MSVPSPYNKVMIDNLKTIVQNYKKVSTNEVQFIFLEIT